jgi:hypothetical protein
MYFYQYSILEYPVLLILSSLFIHQHLWSETEKSELPQDSSKSAWFPPGTKIRTSFKARIRFVLVERTVSYPNRNFIRKNKVGCLGIPFFVFAKFHYWNYDVMV